MQYFAYHFLLLFTCSVFDFIVRIALCIPSAAFRIYREFVYYMIYDGSLSINAAKRNLILAEFMKMDTWFEASHFFFSKKGKI